MNKLTLAYGDGGATLDAAAFPDYAQETLSHEVGAFEPLRLAVARLAEYEACGLDPSEVRRIAEAHQSSEIDAAVLDNGLLTAKDRKAICRMISEARNDKIPTIKKLIQTIIIADKEHNITDAMIIEKSYEIAKTIGFKSKDRYLISSRLFTEAWVKAMRRLEVLKVLDKHGCLIRARYDEYTIRAYINGKRERYIALRIPEQETEAHQLKEGTDDK